MSVAHHWRKLYVATYILVSLLLLPVELGHQQLATAAARAACCFQGHYPQNEAEIAMLKNKQHSSKPKRWTFSF